MNRTEKCGTGASLLGVRIPPSPPRSSFIRDFTCDSWSRGVAICCVAGSKREQRVAINRRCVGDPGAEENRIQQQGVFGWLSEGLGFFD